jgi:hypothetical protein
LHGAAGDVAKTGRSTRLSLVDAEDAEATVDGIQQTEISTGGTVPTDLTERELPKPTTKAELLEALHVLNAHLEEVHDPYMARLFDLASRLPGTCTEAHKATEAMNPRSLSERVRRFSKHLGEGGPWTLHEHVELLEVVWCQLAAYERASTRES